MSILQHARRMRQRQGCLFKHEAKAGNTPNKGQNDNKGQRPCRFFNTPGGCDKGKDCHFKHEHKPEGDKPKSPAPNKGRDGGG